MHVTACTTLVQTLNWFAKHKLDDLTLVSDRLGKTGSAVMVLKSDKKGNLTQNRLFAPAPLPMVCALYPEVVFRFDHISYINTINISIITINTTKIIETNITWFTIKLTDSCNPMGTFICNKGADHLVICLKKVIATVKPIT